MLSVVHSLREHRFVLQNFISRDLKVKYRGTAFGYLWSLLEPLSLVLVYYFVFQVIARRGGAAYPLVVALGVFAYNFMASVVQGGASALVSNASLIRRVYLPREIFVFSQVGSNVTIFALNLVAVIPFLIYYQVMPGWRIVLLPLAALLMTMFTTGLALVVACANAVYRDVGYVIRVSVRLFMYGAPTIYPLTMARDAMSPPVYELYLLNPVTVYISLVRNAVMNQPFPFEARHVLVSAVFAVASLALGLSVFARWEKRAVKYL
ncbi:MAG: ABC transporter permease [Deltaproteobacteria bacterium]|nr:ABC transporter permease [Deltaproteobacteria bacterium]